ncbi:MAG: hypothetical protein RLZZ11_2010 [Cyanobacteriota bacterium]|jgi:hypothetical protein
MPLKFWRPWIDPHRCGEGSQPERYVLRSGRDALFLGIASRHEGIETVADPHRAWAFHTHERAVAAARDIAAVYGQPVDVVKLE